MCLLPKSSHFSSDILNVYSPIFYRIHNVRVHYLIFLKYVLFFEALINFLVLFLYRTEVGFLQWLKKGVTFTSTDYIVPSEICCMINVLIDAKNQSYKLCTINGVDLVSSFVIFYFTRLLFISRHVDTHTHTHKHDLHTYIHIFLSVTSIFNILLSMHISKTAYPFLTNI